MMSRFKDMLKKYGKVAMGVHFSVSAASVTGIYVAINNNVDVESMLEKIGIGNKPKPNPNPNPNAQISEFPEMPSNDVVLGDFENQAKLEEEKKKKNKTAELAASSGGALTLAILLNKALFPVRAPITMVLTPAVARFLARRNLIKNSGAGLV